MKEIRIHGRGGQGGKKLSKIIAQAAFLEGKIPQSFALYGAERRGAPVVSFVRIDDKPIELRGYITNPDVVIVLDDSLLKIAEDDINFETDVIINTSNLIEQYKYWGVDATKIAMDCFSKNIVNTAMCGAFAKVTELVSLRSIVDAIRYEFGSMPVKVVEANVMAAINAYEVI